MSTLVENTAIATYDSDFFSWTQQQAVLLREGRFSEVDAVSLAEEIESMGKSNLRALESYLSIIIMHLLKWRYQFDFHCSSWQGSIDNGRYRVKKLLKESPSLKKEVWPSIVGEYLQARKNASLETGLPLNTFPEQCPFTMEQILGDYWPE